MFLYMNLCQRYISKKNRYQQWKLAIPSIKNLEKANFLFTEVDKCCERFLTPTILKLQRDEINQSLYYAAKLVDQQDITATNDDSYAMKKIVPKAHKLP